MYQGKVIRKTKQSILRADSRKEVDNRLLNEVLKSCSIGSKLPHKLLIRVVGIQLRKASFDLLTDHLAILLVQRNGDITHPIEMISRVDDENRITLGVYTLLGVLLVIMPIEYEIDTCNGIRKSSSKVFIALPLFIHAPCV